MVDVNAQNKTISVNVLSSGVSSSVNASGDTTLYYSNKAREWAISNRIVDGVDYSSKYYAEKSNQSALNSQSFAKSAQDSYKQFQNSVDGALSNIDSSVQGAISEINNAKTDIITNVEFVADGEKEEIRYLANDIKEGAEDIINRVGISMFDTILKDHILSYEESKGLALQGTYAYKNAIAGSRYGYPDFYNKCLEEYNEVTNTETVNGVTVKVHSNGHKFYDISDKTAIDEFFNTYGIADFYGVDTIEERVFLPRNNYFMQLTTDTSKVNAMVEAGLPNITGEFGAFYNNYQSGAFYVVASGVNGHGNANTQNVRVGFDASRSSAIYGNSSTVQPPSSLKLLYYCVGNTTSYEGVTEVVNQGMEILEQVNQGIESRASIDASNFTAEGKSLIAGYPIPDYENRITMSNGFIAPSNGWIVVRGFTGTSGTNCFVYVNGVEIGGMSSGGGQVTGATQIMVSTGDKITWNNGALASYFFPLKGDK